MVSKNTLKSYEFKNIFDYYNYILQSIINGQNKQVRNLINELSLAQKKDAIQYFEIIGETKDYKKAKILILESI